MNVLYHQWDRSFNVPREKSSVFSGLYLAPIIFTEKLADVSRNLVHTQQHVVYDTSPRSLTPGVGTAHAQKPREMKRLRMRGANRSAATRCRDVRGVSWCYRWRFFVRPARQNCIDNPLLTPTI